MSIIMFMRGTSNKMDCFRSATKCLCSRIYSIVQDIPDSIKIKASEIRIRINKNIVINLYSGENFIINYNDSPFLIISEDDIYNTFKNICNYSVYSYQNQIKNGYITFKGGHRIGICGSAIISEGRISNIKNISSLNIRIAREIIGASDKIFKRFCGKVGGILFVGKPSSGKTTVLRDLARKLSIKNSDKPLKKVSIIDERGEIGAVYHGVPQYDVGLCDILDGYPKGEGILYAVRSLSPDFVICDEIGNGEDVMSILESVNSGVKFIASVHAGSIDEVLRRSQIKLLISSGVFEHIVLLENDKYPGEIFKIYKVDDLDV